jgi:hypothetical protein
VRTRRCLPHESRLIRYCTSFSFFKFHQENSFDAATALVRLCNKYEITSLYREAIAFLSACLPTTLDQWDSLASSPPARDLERWTGGYSKAATTLYGLHLDFFLPHLYMSICHNLTLPEILSLNLPPHMLHSILLGRDHLVRSSLVNHTFKWLDPKRKCESVTCIASRTAYILNSLTSEETCRRVLAPWEEVDIVICASCLTSGEGCGEEMGGHDAGRRRVWEELPRIFGIAGSWKELNVRLHDRKCFYL